MDLLTRELNAKNVALKWGNQYTDEKIKRLGWYDKKEILDNIISLGDNPDPDDIDKAIGNTSWTRTECHECGKENIDVVIIGQKQDYESYTAHICKDCLIKAVALIDNKK